MGVQEVVWPEMEAGLEVLRHALVRYRTPRLRSRHRVVYQLRERLSFNVSDRSHRFHITEEDGNRPSSGGPAGRDGSAPSSTSRTTDESAEGSAHQQRLAAIHNWQRPTWQGL